MTDDAPPERERHEEIDWDDWDELAADRADYRRTGDTDWLPVIAALEEKLGLQPGEPIPPNWWERTPPPGGRP